jgi:DNA-binding NarL/FixJ family response regulator
LAWQKPTFNENLDTRKHELKSKSLTPRELEILQLVCDGVTVKEIRQKLNLSEKTVANHCQNMRTKYMVNKISMVVKEGLKKGWIK